MSQLQVRRLPFEFDGVDFIWNASNPAFAVWANALGFWLVGLEHYFVRTMRDADALISDEAVRTEAKLFLQQEAVHSSAHKRHIRALTDRYPDLQHAYDRNLASYDDLYERNDLRFNLAYAAALEGTFTAFFKMVIDNRATLFAQGDSRVASLFLWHFCEEIEHRSSAMIVYNHVGGGDLYRLRTFFPMRRHVDANMALLREEFQKAVPGEAGQPYYRQNPFASVPKRERGRVTIRMLRSLLPRHDPEHQPLPEWAATWFTHFDRGEDMTNFYGTRPNGTGA